MKIVIGADAHEQRLDRFLLKRFPDLRRSTLYSLLRKKKVRLNGRRGKEMDRIVEGDVVEIFLPSTFEEKKPTEESFRGELTLIFEDEEILVAYKPAGLKTIPDVKGELSLSGLVQSYLKEACCETFRPSPVSRLDRNTSGLVLFGKNYQSLKHLNALQRSGGIKKFYLAKIFGTIKEKCQLKISLKKDPVNNQVRVDEEGSMSITEIRPLGFREGQSLVEVELLTGRSHQIRVVLAHLGHPVVGDPKYGRGGRGQCLTAWRLVLEGREFCYLDPLFNSILREEFSLDLNHRHLNPARTILL